MPTTNTPIRNNARLEVAEDDLWCAGCSGTIHEGEEFYAGNRKNLCQGCGEKQPKEN